MTRTLVSWSIGLFCTVLIAVAWLVCFAPIQQSTFGVELGAHGSNAIVVKLLNETSGLQVGDVVLISKLPFSERIRFIYLASPPGTAIALDVVRAGSPLRVVVRASPTAPWRLPLTIVTAITLTISLLILGPIAVLRPSVATAALVFVGAGAILVKSMAGLVSWLPDPVYAPMVVAFDTIFSSLPFVALAAFIVRFPSVPQAGARRVRMHVADAAIALYALWSAFEAIAEPVFAVSWAALDNTLQIAYAVFIAGLTLLAYRDADGDARRRISWVLAAFVLFEAGAAIFDVFDASALSGNNVFAQQVAGQCLFLALPLAIAYAVLRHRVIDLGFALNRTLVFGLLTGIVISAISLLDWFTSRVIGQERFATVVAAASAIVIGFGLEWLHKRLEEFVDRIVFRTKHRAEQRAESRIQALEFARSTRTIDETLAVEAPTILGLASAALFMMQGDDVYVRRAATAWAAGGSTIGVESLLVRTLRATEKPLFLSDYGVDVADSPCGSAQPALAFPLNAQHELIGFVLYGNHADGTTPDPDEVALLSRFVRASAAAYGAVEARNWRERAISLEASLHVT
jgi:hypothetical protein